MSSLSLLVQAARSRRWLVSNDRGLCQNGHFLAGTKSYSQVPCPREHAGHRSPRAFSVLNPVLFNLTLILCWAGTAVLHFRGEEPRLRRANGTPEASDREGPSDPRLGGGAYRC